MRAICRTAIRLMATLLVSAALVALPCKPASAGTGDNYPAVWKNQPLGATYDTWRLLTRYCTSWAAWALHDRNSFELPFFDNAVNWGSRASALGYTVDATPAKGSIAWWNTSTYGHVAYVESVSSDGLTVTISEYNNPDESGAYNLRTISKTAVSGYIHFKDIVEETAVAAAPVAKSRVLFQRGDDMLFALENLDTGFVSETGSGWLRTDGVGTIASGGPDGTTRLWVNTCGAVYAKQGDLGSAGGWTEEAACGTAKSVAISNTGLQMLLTTCGSVYAKFGVSVGGWNIQQECGDYTAIAVGANTQMMLTGCGAVYAKDSNLSYAGWTEEAACGTGSKIAVSNTGLQMMLTTYGAVFAKYGIAVGGWNIQQEAGTYTAIAVGGNTQMLLTSCGSVYAKDNNLSYAGWTEEAACGTATAIAIGSLGRQVIIVSDASVFAKDSVGVGGWHLQVGPGNAKAIAVS